MKLVLNIFLKLIFSFYLIFIPLFSISQQNYYEDIFYGGICFAGFSTGLGSGEGTFSTYIEPNSNIKEVYLFYQRAGNPNDFTLTLDGINYLLTSDEDQISTNFFISQPPLEELIGYGAVHCKKITESYVNTSLHNINIPSQNSEQCDIYCSFKNFGIVIIYENSLLNKLNVIFAINDKDLNTFDTNYSLICNPIDLNFPCAFSLYTDIIYSPSSSNDGSYVLIENNNIGLIGGADQVNLAWGYGTRGHFYYQNNQLFGLDDDTPDNLMNNSDALADISQYLSSTTSINWKMQWQDNNVLENVYSGFFIAHSTPCDTFSVTLSNDTTICRGETLQLFATGGQAYEWKAANPSALTHLSCTDCPNPIFSGDSSALYTVQIWNNDSCSVVRPIKINVRDKPQFSSISDLPSLCSLQTGSISAVAKNTNVLPVSFALNAGSFQVSNTFTSVPFANLASGSYVLHLKDGNSCVSDTTIVVAENNPTQALFSALPSTGAVPLEVQINNTSVFADNYLWYLNDVAQNTIFCGFTADTSGLYKIELIAWQHDPSCADTFTLLVDVYDSLILQIPNIFTPNNDGLNEIFGIHSNLPVSIAYQIFNRWGNVVAQGTNEWSPLIVGGFYELWDASTSLSTPNSPTNSSQAPDGVYFYKINITSASDLLKPSIQKLFPIEKEGFLQLVR